MSWCSMHHHGIKWRHWLKGEISVNIGCRNLKFGWKLCKTLGFTHLYDSIIITTWIFVTRISPITWLLTILCYDDCPVNGWVTIYFYVYYYNSWNKNGILFQRMRDCFGDLVVGHGVLQRYWPVTVTKRLFYLTV